MLDEFLTLKHQQDWSEASADSSDKEVLDKTRFCPAAAFAEQGALAAESIFVQDFHAAVYHPSAQAFRKKWQHQDPDVLPPAFSLERPLKSLNRTSDEAWVVFLWGGETPEAQKSALLNSEVVRTLAHSVRRSEAPLRRPFVVVAVGTLPEIVVEDLEGDGLIVRSMQDDEALPLWQEKWVTNPGKVGSWFQERGLKRVFAQLSAWSLVEYKRVVVLDADTLVLGRCDELFDLGRITFAASPETHKDQEDLTAKWGEGKTRTYLLNAGVFALRPNRLQLEHIKQAAERVEFRWAVERIGVLGEPTFQALIEFYLMDYTQRHGFAVWGPRGGFEGCIHESGGISLPASRPTSKRLMSSSALSSVDHCLLPVDYNFFADFPHVFQAVYNFREEAFRGQESKYADEAAFDASRQALMNSTVRWLRRTGMLVDEPKIVHFPGTRRKPWQRWASISRSPWDDAWWRAHSEMCKYSSRPCRISCK
eukprot:TRINITY_DN15827_c4_g1_i1.p1 TRINITY_DN15827_c4_g1~~TRINITY_DN15827_c4_g1_i1.p1  ORF type:complete len:479 (+),score=76.04 TRINITY_DN15827_c4_g1_i1:176-1612(+)